MDQSGVSEIRLYVEDEQVLYLPFTSTGEFNERIKGYLRTKVSGKDYRNSVRLRVSSPEPLDEDRFRSAVENWISDEKALFRQEEMRNNRIMVGMLIIGSVLIMLSLFLERFAESFSYTLIPIMGSVALGRVASMWIIDWPIIRAKRKLLEVIAQNSSVVFEIGGTNADQKRAY